MNSLIFIAPQGYSIAQFTERARQRWAIREESEDHCIIEDGVRHTILSRDSGVRNEYDDEELATVLAVMPRPEFFTFEFNDFDYGKEVAAELVDDRAIMVDDDHGKIMGGAEFSNTLRETPDWDWR